MKHFLLSLLILTSFFSAGVANAQQESPSSVFDLQELSLEDLLKVQTVSVASKRALTLRETPGIVSVVTDEDIKTSGARDLIDVLRLVPGLEFGVDVGGVLGVGVRGNWAQEAKILLLIDGQEMNELLNGTLQLGNRYPVEQIRKIEIIRGPGSALYGGAAELAVINIITKSAEDLNGLEVSGQYGQYSDTYGRRNLSLAYGKQFDKLSLSVGGFIGQGQLSNRTYTDINGNSYNLKGQSEIKPLSMNIGLGYEGLKVRLFAEKYETQTRDNYDVITNRATPQQFQTYSANVKYDIGVGKNLILTPQVSYLRQLPWNVTVTSSDPNDYTFPYDKTVDRIKASVTTLYDYSKDLNFVFGGEFYRDKGFVNTSDTVLAGGFFGENGDKESLSYNNSALFVQGTYNSSFANITLGARYDYNSTFGGFFAPRAAVTKVIDRFHFKLLADRAFRAPLIENISANPNIKPEYATVFEAEIGYQLSKSSFLSANFFYQTISDAIIYYSAGGLDNYTNAEKTGSRGVELEYHLKEKWGHLNLGYSFYATINDDEVAYYRAPQNKNVHLAFAPQKFTASASFKITDKLSFSPSVILLSKRYGVYAKDTNGDSEMRAYKAQALANVYVLYRDFLTQGLDAGAGVYDIFGQNYTFIQPYDGQHLPLPAPPREFVVRLAYHIGG